MIAPLLHEVHAACHLPLPSRDLCVPLAGGTFHTPDIGTAGTQPHPRVQLTARMNDLAPRKIDEFGPAWNCLIGMDGSRLSLLNVHLENQRYKVVTSPEFRK